MFHPHPARALNQHLPCQFVALKNYQTCHSGLSLRHRGFTSCLWSAEHPTSLPCAHPARRTRMPSSDRVATAFTAESLRHRVTVGFSLIGRLELIEIRSPPPKLRLPPW